MPVDVLGSPYTSTRESRVVNLLVRALRFLCDNLQREIKAFVPMCERALTDDINAVTQEEMERFRRDPSAGFQDHMRKLLLQSARHGFQFFWLKIVEHDDVGACSCSFSSLLVVARFNLATRA